MLLARVSGALAALATIAACSSSYVIQDGGVGGVDAGLDEAALEGGDDGGDGDAAACVPVTVQPLPNHGGAACPSDASACFPGNVTSYAASWVPPLTTVPHANVCTAKQISDAYTLCLTSSGTVSTCSAWVAANATCWGCLASTPTATRYGAGINLGGVFLVNTPGCIALAEPCNQPCATAFQAHVMCDSLAACNPTAGPCMVTTTAASSTAYNDCTVAADSCGCAGFTTPATGCFQLLLDDPAKHPAVALCGLQGGFPQRYSGIATFMCGP